MIFQFSRKSVDRYNDTHGIPIMVKIITGDGGLRKEKKHGLKNNNWGNCVLHMAKVWSILLS